MVKLKIYLLAAVALLWLPKALLFYWDPEKVDLPRAWKALTSPRTP
jgi:hypothetical protein